MNNIISSPGSISEKTFLTSNNQGWTRALFSFITAPFLALLMSIIFALTMYYICIRILFDWIITDFRELKEIKGRYEY